MSRHVWPASPARYGTDASPAKVVHTVEVWTEPGYGPRKDLSDFIAELEVASDAICKDGIAPHTITVSLSYDHDSGGYDGCEVTPKVVLHGERPATAEEVVAEHTRQTVAKEQARQQEAARLRAQLAALEGR